MASTRKTKNGKRSPSSGRGSPEAVAKRRAARQLNSLFSGGGGARVLDGRTEKRRQRLLKELKEGRGGQELKAIEILSHAHELMELGETLSSIRKAGVKPLKVSLSPEDMAIVAWAQKEYRFNPEAWRILGVDLSKLKRKKASQASRS